MSLDSDGDLVQQWQTHKARMAQRSADQVLRDRVTLEAIERRLPEETRAAACDAGLLQAYADGTAQFTWWGAWQLLRAYQRAMQRLARYPLAAELANGIDPGAHEAAALRASADAIAMGKALAARRHGGSRRSKGWLLLAAGVLSLLLFGWQFDWLFALVLVAVLRFHELGHLLAMRWAGYPDLQVFCVPLFGAVASGREEGAAAGQKILVLLAGPLPGIALGIALLHGLVTHALPAQSWLLVTTSTLLIINLFNLLPVLPLDGGRLLDLLLFTRLPRLRGLFAALEAVVLLVGGMWLQTPLMAVLGGVLLLTLPAQFRPARMHANLRRVHGERLDEDARWLRELAEVLTATPYRALRFGQRLALAQTVARGDMGPPPPASTVVIGLVLYCMSLVLALWVVAQHGVDILAAVRDSYVTQGPAGPSRNYEQPFASAANDEARFGILFAAAADAEDSEDFRTAHDYYQRAAALAGHATAYQAQRVAALIGVARNTENDETARVSLQDLLNPLRGDDRATRLQRAVHWRGACGRPTALPRQSRNYARGRKPWLPGTAMRSALCEMPGRAPRSMPILPGCCWRVASTARHSGCQQSIRPCCCSPPQRSSTATTRCPCSRPGRIMPTAITPLRSRPCAHCLSATVRELRCLPNCNGGSISPTSPSRPVGRSSVG